MTKANEQQSFQKRVSRFSTHGKRTGDVDVLPPEAVIQQNSFNCILDEKEILEKQLNDLKERKTKRRLTKEENNRYISIKGMLGNIKKTIGLANEERKAWIFMRVANHRLKHEIFKAIDLEAEMLIAYSRTCIEDGLNNKPSDV